MRRLIELPLWVLGLTVVAAGAVGGGACAAALHLTDQNRGRRT